MRNQFQIEVSEEYDITSGEAVEKWGKDGLRKKLLSNKAAIFEKDKLQITDIIVRQGRRPQRYEVDLPA